MPGRLVGLLGFSLGDLSWVDIYIYIYTYVYICIYGINVLEVLDVLDVLGHGRARARARD